MSAAYSLRWRLLALLIAASTLVWLGVAASSYLRAHEEADEIFDAQLAEVAQTLMALAGDGDARRVREWRAHDHPYQQKILFQIWRRGAGGNALVLRSDNAPVTPVTDREGFSERDWNGEKWRFFSTDDAANGYRVQVAQSHTVRDELAREVAVRLLAPLLLGLPLLAIAIFFVVDRAISPLRHLADEVAARRPERLDPVVASRTVPSEVAPLLVSLNDLFDRMRAAIEKERRFTADAAHELRTPLAALKTQAQVARRSMDAAGRDQALLQVCAGVDRMTRLVEQLLTLARLDPAGPALPLRRIDLVATARTATALCVHQAQARGQQLEFDGEGQLLIRGHDGLVQTLIRNLLENAIRHAPVSGTIGIAVQAGELIVTDDGPGIDAGEKLRVLERFYRGADSGSEGSGLGLSIVARIAELHGARVMLDDAPGGGLRVRVKFSADD
ncbi:MAG: sensor histidine kinase N-terminal domain-containing protein [Proteobacteria bacterium]|nr:sensor histidine kinase N-terminal domain-containing protein [Pseudomonadota bacterium]HQR03606.1 ATP-binding protein [Rhodocyclaceae bacterium]